jgi:hypothetical protein
VNVAKRTANAAIGKASGERQRGLTPEQRGAVEAGVIPIERARAQAAEAKKKREEGDPDPIPLKSKADQQAFMERVAAQLMRDGDAQVATGASAIVKTVLAIQGVEEHDADDDGVKARTFKYATTEGRTVAVRGRESPSGN